jgi:2-oxoglutarate dehydrogenase complex dehydrogenase (E1) component-like enzyme
MAGVDILASAFSGANAAFLAEQYARSAANPISVDPTFAELFGALNARCAGSHTISHTPGQDAGAHHRRRRTAAGRRVMVWNG